MFSSIKCVKTRFSASLLYFSLKKNQENFSSLMSNKNVKKNCSIFVDELRPPWVRCLFSPALGIQGASKGSAAQSLREANHCHVLLGQTSLGQKPIQNCQKELLLNVRGICTHPERDFNALTEWISLPAHQILSANRQPPHEAMPVSGGLASSLVQMSHCFHGTTKEKSDCQLGHMTECPGARGDMEKKTKNE